MAVVLPVNTVICFALLDLHPFSFPPVSLPFTPATSIALNQRVPEVEVVLPIVYGTCAFWLGKKADE